MKKGLNCRMSKNIGIDLGTSNVIVYAKGKGIVLREPSVVAAETRGGKVVAVGNEAKMMLGKTPGSIKAVHPLKDGVIAEFDFAAKMLRDMFSRVSGNALFSRPKVMISIPYGVTEVEKRAVEDVTLEAGAQSVALIEEPFAAAIGAGLRVEDARGSMIIDIGGGTTEVAVISLGGIVLSNSIKIAGDTFDESIAAYIKNNFHVLIGDVTAEELKKNLGSALEATDRGAMEIRGRNLQNGLPAILTVNSAQIREAMSEDISRIIECIRNTLETTPPELSSDIYDSGIMLTGGGALIAGLAQIIAQTTGIRVIVAKSPLDCVAVGIGHVIESDFNGAVSFRNR